MGWVVYTWAFIWSLLFSLFLGCSLLENLKSSVHRPSSLCFFSGWNRDRGSEGDDDNEFEDVMNDLGTILRLL